MTTKEYNDATQRALTDYGDAVSALVRAPTAANYAEVLARFTYCLELRDEREDFHTREADLLASKLYNAAQDMAGPFAERAA